MPLPNVMNLMPDNSLLLPIRMISKHRPRLVPADPQALPADEIGEVTLPITENPSQTAQPGGRVAKVKMQIKEQKDQEFASFVANHLTLTDGNSEFDGIQPPQEEMAAALDIYESKLTDCAMLRSLLKAATLEKQQSRKTLEKLMVGRGASVQCVSAGNPAKIKGAGLGVMRRRTPVGPLPPPMNLRSFLCEVQGVMLLRWDAVEDALGYILEWSPDVQPRQFTLLRNTSQTKLRLENLMLGGRWAFRICTQGGSNGQSPWSAEMIRGVA